MSYIAAEDVAKAKEMDLLLADCKEGIRSMTSRPPVGKM